MHTNVLSASVKESDFLFLFDDLHKLVPVLFL